MNDQQQHTHTNTTLTHTHPSLSVPSRAIPPSSLSSSFGLVGSSAAATSPAAALPPRSITTMQQQPTEIPPTATITTLNPRRVSNSFATPPPVPAHAYQHVKMREHQARTESNAAAAAAAASLQQEQQSQPSILAGVSDLSITPASTPPSETRSVAPAHQLQQEVLRLQAENASVKDELQLLRQRLKAIEDHNIGATNIPTMSNQSAFPVSFDLSSISLIQAEQHALAAWQQSQELDMPLPLMKHVKEFDAEPFLRQAEQGQQLQKDVGQILDYLKPSKRSESRRANVLAFLKLLVRKSLGAQVYPLGAYALKTYVGQDEVMDVSAFFSRAHENTWLHRIVNALCQEASSTHHNTNNIHATNTTSPHYAVSKLSVSFNKNTPYINSCIGGIHCNIYGNHVAGLSSLALFERMDLMCSQEHLLKRTIILVKCWAASKKILNYASSTITPSSSGDDLFSHMPVEGLLSGMFIRTLVLYIFNAYASSITTPLEGLYRLLYFLKDFDWDEHALTVYGTVTLSSLESHGTQSPSKWEMLQSGPTAWPEGVKPFLAPETWKLYLLTPKEPRPPKSTAAANTGRTSASNTPLAAGPNSILNRQPTTRSNSDSHLISLTTRVGGVGGNSATSPSHKTVNTGVLRPIHLHHSASMVQSQSSGGDSLLRPHSHSFDSLDHPPMSNLVTAGVTKQSMHSHSFSNLKQFASPILGRNGDYEYNGGAYSPTETTPTESASITPAQSQGDLQKLLGHANAMVQRQQGSRLGFAASTNAPTLLRSSASTKQLNRLPQPIAAPSSSSFFSSHEDAYSDAESPDFDDDEPLASTGRVHSSCSLDADELEGAEYLDIGSSSLASPVGGGDDDIPAYPSEDASTPPVQAAGEGHLFTRCSLNVLDPVDPTHNLGSSISYKTEFHIRNTLRDGFYVLKNSLQKYAFRLASKNQSGQEPTSDEESTNAGDRAVAELEMHPVIVELFEEAQLSRYKEQLHREHKHRKQLAAASSVIASPINSITPPSSALNLPAIGTVDSAASLWSAPSSNILSSATSPASHAAEPQVFQQAPGPFSSSAFSIASSTAPAGMGERAPSEGSLFAFDGIATPNVTNMLHTSASGKSLTISPPRTAMAQSPFALNPNSTHFVPSAAPTAPLIVDDTPAHGSAALAASTIPLATSAAANTDSSSPSTSTTAPAHGSAPATFDTLSGDIDKIIANLDHARQFETPDLTEDQLVHLIIDLLKERISVPVGRMGCEVFGTKIARADGKTCLIEEVAVGDALVGEDGAIVRVTGRRAGKAQDAYRIVTQTGEPLYVIDEHLVTVRWGSKTEVTLCQPDALHATPFVQVRGWVWDATAKTIEPLNWSRASDATLSIDDLLAAGHAHLASVSTPKRILRLGDVIDVPASFLHEMYTKHSLEELKLFALMAPLPSSKRALALDDVVPHESTYLLTGSGSTRSICSTDSVQIVALMPALTPSNSFMDDAGRRAYAVAQIESAATTVGLPLTDESGFVVTEVAEEDGASTMTRALETGSHTILAFGDSIGWSKYPGAVRTQQDDVNVIRISYNGRDVSIIECVHPSQTIRFGDVLASMRVACSLAYNLPLPSLDAGHLASSSLSTRVIQIEHVNALVDFISLQVDGTNRYVHADGIVTHNSLLHDATNNHSLPAMLKEHYGGLKRLLERHSDIFSVGRDHPYNPSCSLKPKWFNAAPPRPPTINAITAHAQGGVAGAGGLTSNGSNGNLQAMANGVAGDGNNRRKLQRRRTRTRRTNSGATATPNAAPQSIRGGILDQSSPQHLLNSSVPHPRASVTPIIALDCEMVGVGPSGFTSMLARISIVNFAGEVIYDKFVAPSEPVTDYRTHLSGILPHHLESGTEFRQIQREVSQIVKHRILVGHGLMSDLQALCINIPRHQLRDTALFKLYCPLRPLPLKHLVQQYLNHIPDFQQFQEFQHNPIHDARAALALYKQLQQQWESMILQESQQLGQSQHSHSQPSISTMVQPTNHNSSSNMMSSREQNNHMLQMQIPNQHQQQHQHTSQSIAHVPQHTHQPQYQTISPSSHSHFSNYQQQPQQPQQQQQHQQQMMRSHSHQHSSASTHYTSSQSPQLVYDLGPSEPLNFAPRREQMNNFIYA